LDVQSIQIWFPATVNLVGLNAAAGHRCLDGSLEFSTVYSRTCISSRQGNMYVQLNPI